jgi:hypothetical protein
VTDLWVIPYLRMLSAQQVGVDVTEDVSGEMVRALVSLPTYTHWFLMCLTEESDLSTLSTE